MEDHVLLRVPDELRHRIQANIRKPGNENIEPIYYEAESKRNFIFHIGNDKYYAVLKDLPTLVETHKNVDNKSFYKVADVGQILEVSNVKVDERARPSFNHVNNPNMFPDIPIPKAMPSSNREVDDYVDDHGITPPTHGIKAKYEKMKFETVDPKDVEKMDKLFAQLEAEVVKRERSTEEAAKPFIFDELVDEEPYMEYWDEQTVLKQGKDNFMTSAKLAYDKAYERYLKRYPQLSANSSTSGPSAQKPSPILPLSATAASVKGPSIEEMRLQPPVVQGIEPRQQVSNLKTSPIVSSVVLPAEKITTSPIEKVEQSNLQPGRVDFTQQNTSEPIPQTSFPVSHQPNLSNLTSDSKGNQPTSQVLNHEEKAKLCLELEEKIEVVNKLEQEVKQIKNKILAKRKEKELEDKKIEIEALRKRLE